MIVNELAHHGIKGQKWGVRRFQNPDGTYTSEGKKRRQQDHYQRSDGTLTEAGQKRYRYSMSDEGGKKDKFRYDVRNSILEKLKNSEDMKRLHAKAQAVSNAEKEYDKTLDQEYVKALSRFRKGRDLDDMSYKLMKDLYGSSEILNSDNPVYKKRYEGYDDSPEYRKMYLDDLNKVSPKEVCDFIEDMVPPGNKWRNDRRLKESVALVRYRDIDPKIFDPQQDPLYKANKKWSDAIDDIQDTAAKVGENVVNSVLGAGLASEKASNFLGELYSGVTYSDIEIGELLENVNRILQKEDQYYNSLGYRALY